MAVDTPATIAILGAGPVGLEAALYARFLGYDVHLYERGRVGTHVLRWGHLRMFTPFARNCSRLGLAALAAQDQTYRPPPAEAQLSGRQWVERYLRPLSQTDLLADHLREQTTVVSVSRDLSPSDRPEDDEDRGAEPFRVLLRDQDGQQRSETADIVIDATGVFGNPRGLGPAGTLAPGEATLRDRMEYGWPDLAGADSSLYAGQHTLLLGDGCSAATNVVALSNLARRSPGTRVTWVTRDPLAEGQSGPIRLAADDRLPARTELVRAANGLARGTDAAVVHWAQTAVEAVALDAQTGRFLVRLSGTHSGEYAFDRVLANVGFRGDESIYQGLQVDASRTAATLRQAAQTRLGAKDSDRRGPDPQSLVQQEPNLYRLGAKSYGGAADFLFADGLEQVRALFTIIGDRADLDLYATIRL